MIQVFIGTKAQYIKTAPLLRRMDADDVPYRLIDSGQHGSLSGELRRELAVREPDTFLSDGGDIDSIPQAIVWSGRLAGRLVSRANLRSDVFGGAGGVCVVHGDTPSTLLAALMARRAGLVVAHLEAGLRSNSVVHPFPEEISRIATMRMGRYLFAPDDVAMANLADMGLIDRAVPTGANTSVEALSYALGGRAPAVSRQHVVVTMHRVENLKNRQRVAELMNLVVSLARSYEVLFVIHGPTRSVLKRAGAFERLNRAGVETTGLLPHTVFTRALASAPLVVTDGGSVQEECALLGVPTLLWRKRTERSDGIGRNVVLSGYDPDIVTAFLDAVESHRYPPLDLDAEPSRVILDTLVAATS